VLTPTDPLPGTCDNLGEYRAQSVVIARVPSGTVTQFGGVAGTPDALNPNRDDDVTFEITLDAPAVAALVNQLLAAEANGSLRESPASAHALTAGFTASPRTGWCSCSDRKGSRGWRVGLPVARELCSSPGSQSHPSPILNRLWRSLMTRAPCPT